MKNNSPYDSDKFMALSEAQRRRLVAQLNAETPQRRLARPLAVSSGTGFAFCAWMATG